MSCDNKIYVGQIGVLISVETQGEDCPAVDWSDATTLEIICLRPDNTEVTFPAVLNGTKLEYITQTENDLPVPKNYIVQAHVIGPGYNALGESSKFTVTSKWK